MSAPRPNMYGKNIINDLTRIFKEIRILKGRVNFILPTGSIIMYGVNAAPDEGWLICDGTAVSRKSYAALFDAIGTTYGVGDGSTTFNVPDFTNKFPRGNAVGVGGGSDNHSHGAGTLVAQITVTTGPKVAVNRTGVTGWTSSQEAVPTSINAGGTTGLATGANVVGSTDIQNNIPNYTGVTFLIKV